MGTTKRGRDAPGRLSYRADDRCKQRRKKAAAKSGVRHTLLSHCRATGAGRQRHRTPSYLLEEIVQAGGIQNAIGQVFQLRLGRTFQAGSLNASLDTLRHALLHTPLYAHQALVLFLFFEPVGDHLVRLPQVVHLGEDLAGEPLEWPAANPCKHPAPHPNPLELNSLLAHTCTPQTAYNPSRERPKSARHFNNRHASHGL